MPESLDDFIMQQPPTADRPLLGSIILVVEDSRHACEIMRLICQRSGARIRRAESLASAERHLRSYRPRIAVIDLRDFETKQILNNPIALNDHGGTMVTPNTEYVIEGGQYGSPLAGTYAPLEEYNESYRGMVTLWKFDRKAGRIDQSQSSALELPPYWQELFDAGKLVSDGWIFGNSFNTELATGAANIGDTSFFEAGVSQRALRGLGRLSRGEQPRRAADGFVHAGGGQLTGHRPSP